MPILISFLLLAVYVLWVVWGRRTARDEASARLDPLWSRLTRRKTCAWSKTGDSSGRFEEYRCKTCGVAAMTHTGAPPKDCKRNLRAGL